MFELDDELQNLCAKKKYLKYIKEFFRFRFKVSKFIVKKPKKAANSKMKKVANSRQIL